MFKPLIKSLVTGCLIFLCLPGFSLATSLDASWEAWLRNQVNQHYEVIAAKEKLNISLAMADGYDQPVYNPEFGTEYERNDGFDNYRVGVSQAVDIWGKRGSRNKQGTFLRQVAQFRYQQTLQNKLAEALQVLIEYQTSKDLVKFATQQEQQMNTLLSLLQKRHEVGDLGQVDTELAFFNLSQRLGVTAGARAKLRQRESGLHEILPEWTEAKVQIPSDFWRIQSKIFTSRELDELPAVAAAKTEYKMLEQVENSVKLDSMADPTFGISGGEDGGASVVALTLSIPLNIRNNYTAETRVANSAAKEAKSQYQGIKRQYHFAIQAALASLQEYQTSFERWQKLTKGRSATTEQLLKKQWDSGDLSTADYLLASDQRTEGMVAGIELRRQFQLACVEWLRISGQLAKIKRN